jgi:hypothetical protein
LPSHKVALTNKGFKILSNDLQIDFIFLLFVGTLLIYSYSTFQSFLLYAETFLLASLVYILYRYKFGYLYFIGFFYQIILFLLITPIGYLNFFTIFISFLFTVPFLIKQNSFQKIYFPISLYMSLLATTLGLSLEKLKIFSFPKLSFSSSLGAYLPGVYFTTSFSEQLPFSDLLFSPLELSNFYALLALGILFLREFNFFLDLFSYLSFVGILVFLFQFDLELFENKIISLSVTWFLLQAGPGRNFGFSSLFSLLSVITTAIISYLLWKEEWSFPPMLVVFIFFTVQSLFFIIVMEKFLQKIPFLKSVFKK